MAEEKIALKIKAERLGTITEVIQLLQSFENAYNSIYTFNFIVDSLYNDQERKKRNFEKNADKLRKFDPYYYDLLSGVYSLRTDYIFPSLLDLQKIIITDIIAPSDRLYLSRVNIQSPGFWEIIGSLNPLQQIREYLKDRHERKKDDKYKARQEEELGELNILQKKIEVLKSMGYSDVEIRQMVNAMIIMPLSELGKHQDFGQIEGVEED